MTLQAAGPRAISGKEWATVTANMSLEMGQKGQTEVEGNTVTSTSSGEKTDTETTTKTDDTKTERNRHSYWTFVWNNAPIGQRIMGFFKSVLKHECHWFVWQVETGEQGTEHLQGTLYLKKPKRRSAMKKLSKKIHWEATIAIPGSAVYASKLETRTGPITHWGIEVPPQTFVELDEPYGWQLKVIDILKEKPDKRTIYWFWESDGHVGKSDLAKWLYVNMDAMVCSGKSADIKHMIAKRDTHPTIIVYDVPRRNIQFVNYTTVEEIKNGLFMSGKYEGSMVCMANPHIVVFANEPPQTSEMSKDRWKIVELGSTPGWEVTRE